MRRTARALLLAWSLAGLCVGSSSCLSVTSAPSTALLPAPVPTDGTRVWLGPDTWGNRLEDWRFQEGRVACVARREWLALRTAHRLTERVTDLADGFALSVRVELAGGGGAPAPDALGGLLLGVGRGAMDPRSAALVQQWSGPGGGILIGLDGRGRLRFFDNEREWQGVADETDASVTSDTPPSFPARFDLRVALEPLTGGRARLVARAVDPENARTLASAEFELDAARLVGGLAFASHPGTRAPERTAAQFAFRDFAISGSGVVHDERMAFGPIAGTQYTLSGGVLKLSAQLVPLGADDPRALALELRSGDRWERAATAELDADAWNALFRLEGWDASRARDYRVVYSLAPRAASSDASPLVYTYEGRIQADPARAGRDHVAVAVLSCNHNNSHAIGGGWGLGDEPDRTPPNDWVRGIWFPHVELVQALAACKPDLLFFAGDQIYEGKSPTVADTLEIELDYFYKWLLWMWAFRDLTRSIPTVTIPDDHDVYQGNLWGAGGRRAPGADNTGGYVHPAAFVRLVERTQTAHLPDPWSREPIGQGLTTYYTALEWGGVSFAILEDRKFKSGCAGVLPDELLAGRPDHVAKLDWDPGLADRPGLELLGPAQEAFLAEWAQAGRRSDGSAPMRAVLSQTPLACLSTHHSAGLVRYGADLDSNGWPQSGRRRALELLRAAGAVHLNGDQHLACVVRHGIDEFDDGPWSFTAPAIANFYPRAWAPNQADDYRPAPLDTVLGTFHDAFGNPVRVVAVANPGTVDHPKSPSDLYDRMPGFGIAVFDTQTCEVTFECWPRGVDPRASDAWQYAGWPVRVRP